MFLFTFLSWVSSRHINPVQVLNLFLFIWSCCKKGVFSFCFLGGYCWYIRKLLELFSCLFFLCILILLLVLYWTLLWAFFDFPDTQLYHLHYQEFHINSRFYFSIFLTFSSNLHLYLRRGGCARVCARTLFLLMCLRLGWQTILSNSLKISLWVVKLLSPRTPKSVFIFHTHLT